MEKNVKFKCLNNSEHGFLRQSKYTLRSYLCDKCEGFTCWDIKELEKSFLQECEILIDKQELIEKVKTLINSGNLLPVYQKILQSTQIIYEEYMSLMIRSEYDRADGSSKIFLNIKELRNKPFQYFSEIMERELKSLHQSY